MPSKILIEVCCGSVDDAVQAANGHADRIELNSSLFFGGLTPSLGSIIEAKRRLNIPVMVMIRPRAGGFCYTQAEMAVMLNDTKLALEHDADGLVFGILTEDGSIDTERCRQRLDSTHIYSDMGTFGRAKLMGVASRRFLKQLKRHEQALFDQLRPEVQQHCTVSESKLFGDLQSPVSGVMPGHPGDLTIDDFVIDETSHEVQRCPTGHTLMSSQYDSEQDQTVTEMDPCSCGTCDFKDQCPVKQVRDRYIVTHTPAQRRLAARRAEQSTVVFAENYSISGGGESVNSCLKRKTGMGHLRVRGRPNMKLGIFLRCAGWNLSRAVAALRKPGISDFWGLLCHLLGLSSHFGWVQCEGKANRARGLVLKSVGNPKCQ